MIITLIPCIYTYSFDVPGLNGDKTPLHPGKRGAPHNESPMIYSDIYNIMDIKANTD